MQVMGKKILEAAGAILTAASAFAVMTTCGDSM